MTRNCTLLILTLLLLTGCGDVLFGDRVDTRSVHTGGIWSSDNQQIAFVRNEFEELTGYKQHEQSGHRFYLHSTDAARPEGRRKWVGPIDGQVSQLHFMTDLAEGEDYMLVRSTTPVQTEDGASIRGSIHQIMANGEHRILREWTRGFIDVSPSPDGTVLAFVETWLYCDRRTFNIRFMDAQSNETLDAQRWEILGNPDPSGCVERPAMGVPDLEANLGNHPLTGFKIAWADAAEATLMVGFPEVGHRGPFPPTLTAWSTTVGGASSSDQSLSAVCFSPTTTSSRFGPDGDWVKLERGTTIEPIQSSTQRVWWGQRDIDAPHQAFRHGCR